MKCPVFSYLYAVTTFIFANNKFLSATNDCKAPHAVTELQTMLFRKCELKLQHTLYVCYVINTNPFINMTQISTSTNAELFFSKFK